MGNATGLRAVDDDYMTHRQMWDEIDACNKGAKAVIGLVSTMPAPSYASSVCGYKWDHLDEDQRIAAKNHAYNRDLANTARMNEYWKRGRFFNATGRTVESFHGMIWNYSAESNLSPKMQVIAEDVNGDGVSLDELAKDITYDLILNGRYGCLSDMPKTDRQLSSAEQEMPQFRPRLISYQAKDILKIVVMNGKMIDIRLNEVHTVKMGSSDFDYEDKCYTRRLFVRDGVYVNELYDDGDKLIESSTPRANGRSLTFIPFVLYGSDSNSHGYSKPPMFDLAHINLGHFVLDCDNRDNLHYHGQGMTNVFTDMERYEFDAMNPSGLDTGAKGKNMFKAGDKVELLQLDATGAIPAEMERDQERMIQAGAQVVQSNNSTMTLGQKRIESGSSLSTLARIAINTSAGLKKNLEYLAMFAGSPVGDTYQVNTKFITDEMTPELINAHLALVQGGVLPSTTLNESARKAGLTKLDDDAIKDKLLEESESLTGISEREAALMAELDALKAQLEQ